MNGFNLLPKDMKTFNIIITYVKDINEHRSLLSEDDQIQAIEIIEHNRRCGKDDSIAWIKNNAKKERRYLNACKIVLYEMLKDKCVFNIENTYYFIEKYNKNIYPMLNQYGDIFTYFF